MEEMTRFQSAFDRLKEKRWFRNYLKIWPYVMESEFVRQAYKMDGFSDEIADARAAEHLEVLLRAAKVRGLTFEED